VSPGKRDADEAEASPTPRAVSQWCRRRRWNWQRPIGEAI